MKQRFKFIRESKISIEGKKFEVEIWKDLKLKKYVVIDKQTKKNLKLDKYLES